MSVIKKLYKGEIAFRIDNKDELKMLYNELLIWNIEGAINCELNAIELELNEKRNNTLDDFPIYFVVKNKMIETITENEVGKLGLEYASYKKHTIEPKNKNEKFIKIYKEVTTEMMELCIKKNNDYGSSVLDTYEKFGDVSYATRISDKYNRIVNILNKNELSVPSESLKDSIQDLANYCLLWLANKKLEERI